MKSVFTRAFREPLFHFLLLGLGIFFAYGYFGEDIDANDPSHIVVDRDRLLTTLQYRYKSFDSDRFGEMLDKLPEDELQALIDDYVREEVLYREAKTLGLDKNDYVARRRLIQQFEYITRSFISSDIQLSPEELQAYFEENRQSYYVPAKITFTHVYFSGDRHTMEEAKSLAEKELRVLNRDKVPFHEGLSHGERFLYHANYVEKEPDEIASHFGEELQRQVFALEPNDSVWRGPFQSNYGYHLVMSTKRTAGYTPELAEVKPKVERDAARARLEKRVEKTVQEIVAQYNVELVGLESVDAKVGKAEEKAAKLENTAGDIAG